MIYSRGNPKDYDRWESEFGAEGWGFDAVLPDFKAIETSYLGVDNGYHGESGEVPVSYPTSHTKSTDVFLEAGRELGYSNNDYNGPNQTNVIADLPVGEKLFDHVTVNGIAATTEENIELNYYDPSTIPEYALSRTGPLTHAYGVEGVAFLSTPGSDPTLPDIQFLFVTLNPTTIEAGYVAGLIGISQIYDTYYKPKRGQNVLMIVPVLLHPSSSGYIRLKSTDAEEYPIIQPQFFSESSDVDTMVDGNLNFPTMMMGHKAAAMIIEDNQQ
ncbi:hypothetical protein V5799_007460 [Amblyomma americanum]|uniref:Glucose-methanol-choline oxidoreductase N-terminal domain-containing protein n=1 Tax=Amblyomma americanum TaxID=6943 RepID=A0AAQ4FHB8_AMBAM